MDSVTVVTNGNDPQLPQIIRLLETCRQHEPLKSTGRFVVLSDQLAPDAVRGLQARGADVRVLDSEIAAAREALHSDVHVFGKLGKPVLLEHFLRTEPHDNIQIAYLDPDVVVLESLVNLLAGLAADRVFMPELLYPTQAWGHCVRQLQRADSIAGRKIDPKGTEWCTGVLLGRRAPLLALLEAWTTLQLQAPYNPLCRAAPGTRNAWHDQDFFRLLVRLRPELRPATIPFHIAPTLNPPADRLFDLTIDDTATPPRVRCVHAHWLRPPLLCHFTGPVAHNHPTIRRYYDTAIVPSASPAP